MSLLYYNRDYLRLSGNFTAYDTTSQKINKEQFLQLLTSGEYLPLRLATDDSSITYKLYKLPDSTHSSISGAIQQIGEEYHRNYKREGQKFPAFDFFDLNGRRYNNESTSGKILVLKFWFIHCGACIKEMPRLNQLVKEHNDRSDILFLSFAFDSKEDLTGFLKKTTFDYGVIPVSKRYLAEELKIYAYPTHMIVNKKGVIKKVVHSDNEIISSLQEEILMKD